MSGPDPEWWNLPKDEAGETEPRKAVPVEQAKPVRPSEPTEESKTTEAEEKAKSDRRQTLFVGAVGAVLVGAVLLIALPDGDNKKDPAPVASVLDPADFPPPAGEVPREAAADEVPLTGDKEKEPVKPVEETVEEAVLLTAVPAGQGDTGALVKVTISNNTESTITVMSSMMQGDGRSAMVGEGTLAPGSRRIDPGETAEGTVEFVTKKPPQQIVLTDLSGGIVASSS